MFDSTQNAKEVLKMKFLVFSGICCVLLVMAIGLWLYQTQAQEEVKLGDKIGVEELGDKKEIGDKIVLEEVELVETNDTSPNFIGGFKDNWITSGVYGATISGGGQSDDANRVTDNYGTVGGGRNNQAGNNEGTTEDATCATVGGGRNNTASGYSAIVGGGRGNTASGYSATVGGGSGNTASDNYATVGGGYQNTASGNCATVGGGTHNETSDSDATVGGGCKNEAGGLRTTVGGGESNKASANQATVGGGYENTASGDRATVGGGAYNKASGNQATIPGGRDNTANGTYSFAAGQRAKAIHRGAFVWGDSTDADITSFGNNQFIVRAFGGTWIISGTSASVVLPANGSAWVSRSDRSMKRNIRPVDGKDILSKLAHIPISRWSYKAQDPQIEHIGPMAQDFYSAFGLGEDDKHISTIDPDGVALAAIQGLYEMVQEKDAQIAAQQQQIVTLESRLAALEALILSRAQEQQESGHGDKPVGNPR